MNSACERACGAFMSSQLCARGRRGVRRMEPPTHGGRGNDYGFDEMENVKPAGQC